MRTSTSAKLPSKVMKTIKHPRKVLKITHINICSKVHEINHLLVTDHIHILTISETHLDNTFKDTVVAIHGCNIYRKDRSANGGGLVVYTPNHIPVK
jgi:hypothetical protein